uniref:Alternative protein C13orf34 n=1 Tax=Homo sapiens TaxID=9606 RepID=L8EAE2_HUMAN|nr:alternative protein C13orf34 [Homo sapiens]
MGQMCGAQNKIYLMPRVGTSFPAQTWVGMWENKNVGEPREKVGLGEWSSRRA